jgi:hypothetical protein
MVEKFRPNFIEATKIIHIHKKYLHLNQIVQAGTGVLKDIGNIFNNRTRLRPDIEIGYPHWVNLNPFEGIVGPSRAGARHENEVTGAPVVRKTTSWLGFPTNNR